MEDVTLLPIGINLNKSEDGDIAQLVITSGFPLPIQDPNTGGPVQVPSKTTRIPLRREHAEEVGKALLAVAEELNPNQESRIHVASSLNGIDNVVDLNDKLRAS